MEEMEEQIMPRLSQQNECIMSKMGDVDILNEKTMRLEKELTSIEETRGSDFVLNMMSLFHCDVIKKKLIVIYIK